MPMSPMHCYLTPMHLDSCGSFSLVGVFTTRVALSLHPGVLSSQVLFHTITTAQLLTILCKGCPQYCL